jgi:hypothetical protein
MEKRAPEKQARVRDARSAPRQSAPAVDEPREAPVETASTEELDQVVSLLGDMDIEVESVEETALAEDPAEKPAEPNARGPRGLLQSRSHGGRMETRGDEDRPVAARRRRVRKVLRPWKPTYAEPLLWIAVGVAIVGVGLVLRGAKRLSLAQDNEAAPPRMVRSVERLRAPL